MNRDEIDNTHADLNEIAGLIQRKFGVPQDEVQTTLSELIAKFRSEHKEKQVYGQDIREINSTNPSRNIDQV